jgi:hypothetical protein
MIFRSPAPHIHVLRFARRAAHLCGGVAVAATLGGCPYGAELENPEQNKQYFSGAPGVGGAMGGSAGVATGGAGAAQGGTAGAPIGGAGAGTAGGAGMGSGTWTWNCAVDVRQALKDNCARAGCHSASFPAAGLTLVDPATFRATLVDKPATYTDIDCDDTAMFRACTPDEAVTVKGCTEGAKLIDPNNLDASWVLKKIDGQHATCGDAMPIAPGNSPTYGWDAAGMRKTCFIDFFRSLAAP